MSNFERIIEIYPPFDKRNADPKKNYGIHGMELRFVLKGELGATHFVYYTCQHLPHVAEELWRNNKDKDWNPFKGMGVDIGYHSKIPTCDGHTVTKNKCPYTEGDCYYDGSSLQADEFTPIFLEKGTDAVWEMLEERYHLWLEKETA